MIIKNLKKRTTAIIFVITILIAFGVSYYLMATLPGTKDEMCFIGASLTPFNIGFSIIFSILLGLMVANLYALYKEKQKESSGKMAKSKILSLSGFGAAFGTLTLFCTLCTLPVLTLFGFSVGFGFFTDFNIYFKGISILFLGLSLYLVNKQLTKQCSMCKMPVKK